MMLAKSHELELKKSLKSVKKDQDLKYLEEVIKKETSLGLGPDTYAMAFKAFSWTTMRELDMDIDEVHNTFHAAMFVFGFQVLMIVFIGSLIFGGNFQVTLPEDITVLGARFVCTILMHLQVEGDLRQGLKMMKYVSNQPFDFSNPQAAFFVALMQILGGLFAEFACIIYLCSLSQAIDVIIKFVALASIAKVDDFYASALPEDGNKIKKKSTPLKVHVHKRDWQIFDESSEDSKHKLMATVGKSRHVVRFVFKFIRVLYASFIFYFLPYVSLFLPYITSAAEFST